MSSSQPTFIFFRGVGQPPSSIYIYKVVNQEIPIWDYMQNSIQSDGAAQQVVWCLNMDKYREAPCIAHSQQL